MARDARSFAGQALRRLRLDQGLDQAAMSALLGISVSYLSQLENDDRPLTARVKARLVETFPLDWTAVERQPEGDLPGALTLALAQPGMSGPPIEPERVERFRLQFPELARRFADLHRAYRHANERLAMMEEAIGADNAAQARMPWEAVRDWFHEAGNYIHPLDRLAEDLSKELDQGGGLDEQRLVDALAARQGIDTLFGENQNMMRAFQPRARRLFIDSALPPGSRKFLLAHQLMMLEGADAIAQTVAAAGLSAPGSDRLLSIGLGNYAAGALLMPYQRFRDAARALRHDVDRLAHGFGVSFEQACHRLSTLQRPGMRGVPVFFFRVDLAGNITKRHSATRLQFARFGGACPLWNVHEAAAIPDRINVQLVETPDGVRYVSMAKGLVKPSGRYDRAPRRYAVALGCEVEHAGSFVYADGLALHGQAAATPIGVSCRLCERRNCDQRAFPPADRPIRVDLDHRRVVPYVIE